MATFDFSVSISTQILFVSPSLCCFLWLCLLSIFGLESFCLFMRMRTSFIGGVLAMMLQVVCGMFRDIPLGYEKVPSSEFLDLVASWLSNL